MLVTLAGLTEAYFAIRVRFDAALFHQLASAPEALDFAGTDAALTRLGLLPAAEARPASRGARRRGKTAAWIPDSCLGCPGTGCSGRCMCRSDVAMTTNRACMSLVFRLIEAACATAVVGLRAARHRRARRVAGLRARSAAARLFCQSPQPRGFRADLDRAAGPAAAADAAGCRRRLLAPRHVARHSSANACSAPC